MANEIQADFTTGKTLYAQVRSATGAIWNTASAALQAYVTANIADYDIAMTEQGTASGYYAGNMPAAAGGVYNVVVKVRVGGAPAETDPTIATGQIEWSGTVVNSLDGVFSSALTESYAADGAAPTLNQALFMILGYLFERNLSGNTISCSKLDGSTVWGTFTIDSATATKTQTRTT